MIDIIITADVMGLLICLVTLYGNCFESRQDGEIQKRFSVLVLTTVFMLIIDTLSYVTAHVSVNEAVRYAVDIIANIGTFVIASAFAMYLYTYVKVKYGKKLKRLIFLVAADVAFTVIALVGCLTKGIFSIENGVYVVGPLYGLYIVLNVLQLLLSLLHLKRSFQGMIWLHCFHIFYAQVQLWLRNFLHRRFLLYIRALPSWP